MKEKQTRPETDVMCFKGDWPGVFIRGDNCFGFANVLEDLLKSAKEIQPFDRIEVESLILLLRSSACGSDLYKKSAIQRMKLFEECFEEIGDDFP